MGEEKFIAVGFRGIFVPSEIWDDAHEDWFDQAADELHDPTVRKWIGSENYFDGVDQVMKLLHPELTDEQRTIKARERYFAAVLKRVEQLGSCNEDVISVLQEVRELVDVILLTTNTQSAITRMLEVCNIDSPYTSMIVSEDRDKDDKERTFEQMRGMHGLPALYIGGDHTSPYELFLEHRIPCIFFDANGDSIEGVETASTPLELRNRILTILKNGK